MSTAFDTDAQHVVRAIDTEYKSYKFRSRLEARWAVFFDHLSLKWQYEVEGFELPSGRYLPDFYFPDDDLYVEIKPARFYDDLKRGSVFDDSAFYQRSKENLDLKLARELAEAKCTCVVVFCGDPGEAFGRPMRVFVEQPVLLGEDETGLYERPYFHEAKGKLERSALLRAQKGPDCVAAAKRARSARFEHGAKP